jgi:hypothetical protein
MDLMAGSATDAAPKKARRFPTSRRENAAISAEAAASTSRLRLIQFM